MRRRRFWEIQGLVLFATAAHYSAELAGYSIPEGDVHQVALSLYMVPLLYAALSFGWEGTLMTGLWGAVLTSPSIWIWHHSGFSWLAELVELGIIMSVGMLVAWRVDRESKQRLIAERTSAELSLLNRVGEALSHTLEVEQRLPEVLRRAREALGLDSTAAWLEAETPDSAPVVIEEGASPFALDACLAVYKLAGRSAQGTLRVGEAVVAVLRAEGGPIGFLAGAPTPGTPLNSEQIDLLATIGREIAIAVENARLYRQRQDDLRSYVRQVTQAHEDERMRMARELHDDTLQEMVLLARDLEQVATAADPQVARQAESALAVARHLASSMRSFSQNLRPSILDDLGVLAAIEMVVEEADRLLPNGARMEIEGPPRRVDSPVAVALFRIVQEALRNIEKHAKANAATVEIRFDQGEIALSITDDGVGFTRPRNVSEFARLGKLGVLGIKERAELVGGTFSVRTETGHGTTIVVSVPSA